MDATMRKKLILFSGVEALYFAIFAISSYQTVFLQGEGLTSAQIGVIASLSSIVGLSVSPVWGILSDRLHSAKIPFLISICVTTVLYGMMPLLGHRARGSAVFFGIYIPVIFAFKQASNAMLDGWCIGELAPGGISYGSARMWGSIGYCVMSTLLGMSVGVLFSVRTAFLFMLPLLLVLMGICSRLGQTTRADAERQPRKKGTVRALLGNERFLVYLVYSLGLNIYLGITLIFMPYILEAAGCRADQMGTVTGLRALMEIISMLLGVKLSKKIPVKRILLLPGILFGIEHLCYAQVRGLSGMFLVMVLSGLAGGFFYSLGPSYIYQIVEPETVNTAQAFNAMDLTAVSIVGSALGGTIIRQWGVHTLTTGCGVLILLLTAFFSFKMFQDKT